MSTDLLDQLARYGADHRARQEPVERTEILRRVHTVPEPDLVARRAERPRTRFLVATAAATVALIGGLLLLGYRDSSAPTDDPDIDQIHATEPSIPSSTAPSTTTVQAAIEPVDQDEASAPAPERSSIAARVTVGEPEAVAGTAYDSTNVRPAFGPWDDGFMLVTATGGERLVPQLSEEIQARFPPEVLEAYPDGIGGTLSEAMDRLWQDGLLDEVQAALEADQELNEAINSGPITPVELAARISADGETWTPVDMLSPDAVEVDTISIVANRVVVVGSQPLDLLDDSEAEFRSMIVASTVDLTDWSVQVVPGVAGTRPDLVDSLHGLQFAANASGWVAHVEPRRCEVDGNGEVACGRPGSPAEGGTSPDVGDVLISDFAAGEGPPTTWVAAWDAEPAPVDGLAVDENVTVMALPTGFVAQHDVVEFSPDGTTWAPIPEVPLGIALAGALPLDDGGSAVVGWDRTSCRTRFYRVDRTGHGWAPIELDIDGAPRSLLPSSPFGPVDISQARVQSSSASLFDASGPLVSTHRWEQDALELTLVSCSHPSSTPNPDIAVLYELVDAGTGKTLVAEIGDRWPLGDPDAFEYLTISADGALAVRDPSSGDVLFDASFDDGSFVDVGVGGREDIWLLATATGTDWLVDDLDSEVPDLGDDGPLQAVRNGETVLIATSTDWLRYELPTR